MLVCSFYVCGKWFRGSRALRCGSIRNFVYGPWPLRLNRPLAEPLRRGAAYYADQERGVRLSHALGLVQRICQHGAVLEDGKLTYYTNVDDAILHHQEIARKQLAQQN